MTTTHAPQPWFSLVDLFEADDCDGPRVVRRSAFTIWNDDGSSAWGRQTPASFFVEVPRFDGRDAIVGAVFHAFPAAQQYGMKATAWVREARREAEAAAAIESDPQPF